MCRVDDLGDPRRDPACLARLECGSRDGRRKKIRVWVLDRGKPARELASVAVDTPQPLTLYNAAIDLSPDGKHIAVSTNGLTNTISIIPTEGTEPAKTLATPANTQSLLWPEPAQ